MDIEVFENIVGIFIIILFSLFGSVFLVLGIKGIKRVNEKRRRCTSKTCGRVKEMVNRSYRDSKNEYSYKWCPIFEYSIGEQKIIKESYGRRFKYYSVGQEVEVYYNPNDYEDYYVLGYTNRAGYILTTIFGIVIITMSVLFGVWVINS